MSGHQGKTRILFGDMCKWIEQWRKCLCLTSMGFEPVGGRRPSRFEPNCISIQSSAFTISAHATQNSESKKPTQLGKRTCSVCLHVCLSYLVILWLLWASQTFPPKKKIGRIRRISPRLTMPPWRSRRIRLWHHRATASAWTVPQFLFHLGGFFKLNTIIHDFIPGPRLVLFYLDETKCNHQPNLHFITKSATMRPPSSGRTHPRVRIPPLGTLTRRATCPPPWQTFAWSKGASNRFWKSANGSIRRSNIFFCCTGHIVT